VLGRWLWLRRGRWLRRRRRGWSGRAGDGGRADEAVQVGWAAEAVYRSVRAPGLGHRAAGTSGP